jgi:hypothetical protein
MSRRRRQPSQYLHRVQEKEQEQNQKQGREQEQLEQTPLYPPLLPPSQEQEQNQELPKPRLPLLQQPPPRSLSSSHTRHQKKVQGHRHW